MSGASDKDVVDLLAADVIQLELENIELAAALIVAREMVSELLDISHQALVHIYTTQRAQS